MVSANTKCVQKPKFLQNRSNFFSKNIVPESCHTFEGASFHLGIFKVVRVHSVELILAKMLGWLLRILSMSRSYFCTVLVCVAMTFAHS